MSHMRDSAETMSSDRSLPEKAASTTRITIVNWLEENNDQITALFPSEVNFFPLVGGSLVEGLMTRGSDLDFCMMIDSMGRKGDTGKLESSFKHSMSELDNQLRQMGLSGICRVGRRIRNADRFLILHRCHESKAAMMRTGALLNYVLSCQLLHMEPHDNDLNVTFATDLGLLRLKKRLYQSYHETLGYSHIPVLPYLLKHPGGYTPRRVFEQIQLAVNNVLLVKGNIDKIQRTLEAKVSEVINIMEKESAPALRAEIREKFSEAIELFRELKQRAAIDRNLHGKSFCQLTSKGYVDRAQWEHVRWLTEYTLKLASGLTDMVGL